MKCVTMTAILYWCLHFVLRHCGMCDSQVL